ncbi:MAG: response regulator [Thermodesulfobacteriota bacterium]
MKAGILFVDDDPSILNGLRRSFIPMEDDWDMAFAPSGPEALDLMARQEFQIIVSDMLMPGMNGTELLQRVRNEHPRTVRFVLSGHSDRNLALISVRAAHQYLSKPCPSKVLHKVLSRAVALRQAFTNPLVLEAVTRTASIPVLPDVLAALQKELQNPEGRVEAVTELVAQDLGLYVGVLKTVNSMYYGNAAPTYDLPKAVSLLGLDVLRGMVSSDLFTPFDTASFPGFSVQLLRNHCQRTAALAETIARESPHESLSPAECSVAGLLHDLGKLIMADTLPEEYRKVLEQSRKMNIPPAESERNVAQVSHAEVGGYLLGLWGFSDAVVQAVAHHHAPQEAQDAGCPVLCTLHVANGLDHKLVAVNPHYGRHSLDMAYLQRQGADAELPTWTEACARAVERHRASGNGVP